MKNPLIALLTLLIFSLAAGAQAPKEWTFLVFLNGHSNLDYFGQMNIEQMKEIGSTDQVNIVVQWASIEKGKTRRLYIEKGNLRILEEMEPVDMGDVNELIRFAEWGHKNFPAKKYFLNIWNHGFGWHYVQGKSSIKSFDISSDDLSKNRITTEELGWALQSIQKITGRPLEIYGSDACLMSMLEVASEIGSAAKYFVGSQHDEPAQGWPYNKFLQRWVENPFINGAELAQILTEEYHAAYTGGIYGKWEVTFSGLDMSKLPAVEAEMNKLSQELLSFPETKFNAIFSVLPSAQKFAFLDYKDSIHFLQLQKQFNPSITLANLDSLIKSIENLVLINRATPRSFSNANGVSIWIPNKAKEWHEKSYGYRYLGLKFHQATGWGSVLKRLYERSAE